MKKSNKSWDIVILSPHMDDAVLSLGQHLIRWKKEGKKIKIITVFTKFEGNRNLPNYSKDYLKKSGFSSVEKFERMRVAEDVEAMRILGVDYEHWGFVDAGFRGIYKTREALLNGRVDKKDEGLENQIKKKLKEVKTDLVLFPYGVGGHVDHVILKKAAEKIKSKKYYLEEPYLWQNFNFIKFFWKIIKAKSIMRGEEGKRKILRNYQSQYDLLVKNSEAFMEIII